MDRGRARPAHAGRPRRPAPCALARIVTMYRHRHPQRRASFWLLLAWVMVTLSPSVSRAAAFVQDRIAPWAVVCSAVAEADGSAADGHGRATQALQHLTEHCPACVHAGEAWAPPPAAASVAPADRRAAWLARLFLSAPRTLHAWASAQPRAPPAA